MESTIAIGTRINFKQPIDILKIQPYISFLEEYSRTITSKQAKLNKFTIPASDDQPLNLPMAVIQMDDTFSASVSRGGIAIQSTVNARNNSIDVIAKHLSGQLSNFISSSSLFSPNQIKSISCSISRRIPIESLFNLKEVISMTPYSALKNEITDYGFSLEMFTTPIISGTTSQSFSYTTLIDEEKKQSMLQIASNILIGGINFSTKQYVNATTEQIEKFINSITKESISEILRKLYAGW